MTEMESIRQLVTIALSLGKYLKANIEHREWWLAADTDARLDFWLQYHDHIDMIVEYNQFCRNVPRKFVERSATVSRTIKISANVRGTFRELINFVKLSQNCFRTNKTFCLKNIFCSANVLRT